MAGLWADKEKEYVATGQFSSSQINEYKEIKRKEYLDNGVDPVEVSRYFGDKTPDESTLSKHFQKNLESYKPEEAKGFIDAIDAGWQMSSTDLMYKAYKGKNINPDTIVPDHAPTYMKVASGLAQITGDVPAMIGGYIAGKVGGGVIGEAVSGGNPLVAAISSEIGANAGANAAPEFIRTALMEHYNRGEFKTAGEFADYAATVFMKTLKAGTVGAVTAGVGKGVGGKAASLGASETTARLAQISSEIVTMTTVSKALEGELPNADDFVNSAIMIGTIGAISKGVSYSPMAVSKMGKIFAKKGIRPEQVAEDAATNPTLKQEILSDNDAVPSYGIEGSKIELPKTEEATTPAAVPEKPVSPNLARIGEQPEKIGPGYSADQFYTDIVDKLYPIKKQLSGLNADSTADDVYNLFRMIPDYKAKVKAFVEGGSLSFKDLSYNGKSFKEITKPFETDSEGLNGFKDYLISKRVLELEGRQIKHGFDVEYSKNFVKENSAKYESSAKEFYDYNNRMLDYLVDSERLSKDQAKSIKEANSAYVSFARIIENGGGIRGTKGNIIKGIKGSERMIQDPFLSMVENFQTYMKAAEENRAKLSMVKLVESLGEDVSSEVMSQNKTKMKAIEVKSDEITRNLEKQGIEIDDAEAFSIFRPADKTLAQNEFAVWRKGKREVWTIHDDMLAAAVKSNEISLKSANPILQIMSSVTRVKKIGIQLTPDFISRNFFRDQVASGVFTQSEAISLVDTFSAMKDIFNKSDDYYNWLKSGGANGAFIEFGDRYLSNEIYKSAEMMSRRERVMNVLTKPVQFLEAAGNLAEQSTRLAEFKRVVGDAKSGPIIFKGGMAAREVTLDFQRIGAKTQALNQIIAFLNPSIQGMDKTVRAMRASPLKFTGRAAAYITLPSVLLWWANKDDERYQEIPQWQKDFFWIIPTDDWQDAEAKDNWPSLPKYLTRVVDGKVQINKGTVYRIPKPQELGLIFGSLPERTLNAFYKDNKSATFQLQETLLSAVVPNMMPDAFAPVLEQMTNKSMFSGGHLVPFYLEGALPEDQYKEYTSETARVIGKMIGYVPLIKDVGPDSVKLPSPIVVENYIRNWTGNVGGYALQMADTALKAAGLGKTKVEPSMSLADMPVIKAFVARYPTMSTDSMQRFQKELTEQKQIQASFKLRIDRMQTDSAIYLVKQHETGLVKLDGFKQAMSRQNSFINKIYYNNSYSPDEKRQLIDTAYYQMVEIAKAGLEVTRQLDLTAKKLDKEIKK